MLLSARLFAPAAWAYDFRADGIYYNITSSNDKTVAVTYRSYTYTYNSYYSGDITIPATVTHNGTEYRVTSIGNGTFYNCFGLTTVTIPNSVTAIGSYAFAYCDGLSSVTIPNSVTSIGEYAFAYCDGLSSVTIPNSVTSIGEYAFLSCDGLESVTIGNNVPTIGIEAFYSCPNLARFEGKWASSDNRCLVVNDTLRLFASSGLSEYAIPDDIKVIGERAFEGSRDLTSVTIPESVISIGGEAFESCKNLTSVTIPNSVIAIGEEAFGNCTGLMSVTIPNSVTSIDNVFNNCTGLKKVYISDLAAWCRIVFKDYFSNPLYYAHNLYLDNTLVTDLKIPDGVTEIYPYAFSGCWGLTSVTIPDGVTSIGYLAFYGCTGLRSVTIGESVTTIGKSAFWGCTGLTSVTIPNSVTAIDYGTFCDCSGLTSVTIPESVTAIGDCAFSHCNGLTSVTAYNPTPAYIGGVYSPAFDGLDCANCTLYVPAESVEKYKKAEGWKEFGEILPIDESSAITEIQQENADGHVTVYNLQGVLVLEADDAADLKTLQNGAYIVNGKTMIIAR